MDQNSFLHQMEELIEFGRTKDSVLTKDEVRDYCADMNLTEEQLEFMYAYLSEHQIHIPGYQKKEAATDAESGRSDDEKKDRAQDSKYLQMYREELEALKVYTEDELQEQYDRLRRGEEEAVAAMVEAHLNRVVMLAEGYRDRGVLLEDLIQEGNLELMTCVSMLCGNQEVLDYGKAIDHAVRSRLIELVDEAIAGTDSVNSVVAKVNLLLEATHVLAEELGRIATLEELAEFTHMEEEEIQMYADLTKGEIALGKGEQIRNED